MKSMTGYAKQQCIIGTCTLNIEIKTLNSKQLDLTVKLPNRYKEKELEIRQMMNRLERGKVDVIISSETTGTEAGLINSALVRQRLSQAQAEAEALGLCPNPNELYLTLLRSNDIWNSGDNTQLDETEASALLNLVSKAIDEVDAFRLHEGNILQLDFEKHITAIEERLHALDPLEQERIDGVKRRLHDALEKSGLANVDLNRFEEEIIFYLEKLDVTEEKVRLQKHIDYFRQTMLSNESNGKKLNFIAQEMGREINTTGSKANHAQIQRIVVEMKDELEKIKEQLGNIL